MFWKLVSAFANVLNFFYSCISVCKCFKNFDSRIMLAFANFLIFLFSYCFEKLLFSYQRFECLKTFILVSTFENVLKTFLFRISDRKCFENFYSRISVCKGGGGHSNAPVSKLLNSSFLQISKHFFSGNFKTFLFSKLQNSSFLQIPKHFSILQLTLSRSLELKLQNCKFPKNFFIFHSTIAADWAKAQKFECNHCCMQFKNEFLGEKKCQKGIIGVKCDKKDLSGEKLTKRKEWLMITEQWLTARMTIDKRTTLDSDLFWWIYEWRQSYSKWRQCRTYFIITWKTLST